MCLKHIDYLGRIKPEKLVCLEIRNHIAWYLKGLKNSNLVKIIVDVTYQNILESMNHQTSQYHVSDL